MALSTRDLSNLGSLERVRSVVRAQAVLTALLYPERPEIRFLAHPDGVEQAGWDNEQGDDLLLLFTPEGALIRGFDHESPISPYNEEVALAGVSDSALEELSEAEELELLGECRPFPGVLDELPAALRARLEAWDARADRLVAVPSVLTFCVWQTPSEPEWRVGSEIALPANHDDADGSALLMQLLDGGPEVYQSWAAKNYRREVDLATVQAVYAQRPLTAELAGQLSPGVTLDAARSAIEASGYPVA